MSCISVLGLSKTYFITNKKPGLRGAISNFIRKEVIPVKAVDDISFEINPGEIVGFIGPNGAGKTTTLKMLCGLIHPSSGELRVSGYRPQLRKPAFLNQITLVMGQKQQLIWDLPPLDSFRVNAAVYGIPEAEASRRITELSSMLDLNDELTRPVRKLSLGQRMKAELLASLLHRPKVLFLDEPSLGLDVNAQARVREFLIEYNRIYKATILLTSHYMGDITSLCKRVLVIDKGKLFHDGSLDQLTNRFSPFRSVKIKFSEVYPRSLFTKLGTVEHHDQSILKLKIKRTQLSSSLSYLLQNFDIIDLEIKDPPIEQLIRDLFNNNR